jgi:phytoene dehydrogenase-like protein
VLEDGTEIGSRFVLSNADPKRTFLKLVEPKALPEDFRSAVAGIKMDGPSAKVNLVLAEEPKVTGMPPDADPNRRSLFTLVPSAEYAEKCYDKAKLGEIPEDLWVDCVVASNVDPSLAPEGKHDDLLRAIRSYRLSGKLGREAEARDRVVEIIGRYARNVPERSRAPGADASGSGATYGLTEGNIFHGDLSLSSSSSCAPFPVGASTGRRSRGLPRGRGRSSGGGVTGVPGTMPRIGR